mmetsp:Transcript_50527/g.134382  ORF Transcript_50527/g.134382 Transcript_50527/m.134382 type:complete len:367 (-) Transcript_50527:23-1123(-)
MQHETRRVDIEMDTRFITQSFLEAAELGDAASLRSRFEQSKEHERRQFVKQVDQQGRSGLILAARAGDTDLVRVLLEADANPNDADLSGCTPLHYAATRSEALPRLLLEFLALPDARDDWGDTPLMWASGAVVGILLAARADPHARNSQGRTALILASARGDVKALSALAATNIDLDTTDSLGSSAHGAAVAAEHHEAAEFLARHGATVPEVPEEQHVRFEVALCQAARQGDVDSLGSLLLVGGRDTLDTRVAGEAALLLAAGCGCFRAVELLLQAKADPNLADEFLCETPLMRAVLANAPCEVLWLLLEARADPSRVDLSGRTAGDIAVAWNQDACAEILRLGAQGELNAVGLEENPPPSVQITA